MPTKKDYYEILGVPKKASEKEIKAAYRRQALKFHPDKFADTSDKIMDLSARETERLNQAYEMISKERSG